MADQDTIQLKVTEDSKGIDQAKKKIEDLRKELKDLQDQFKRQGGDLDDFLTRQGGLESKILRTEEAVRKLSGGLGISGNAIVQWSRAAQDFQAAGFAGIANNMELMASSLGAPAFVAGLATLAGTFGPMLIRGLADAARNLGLFGDETDKAISHIDRLQARIKALEEKPVKIAVDAAELDALRDQLKKIEEGKARFDKSQEDHSKPEQKAGSRVNDILSDQLPPADLARIEREISARRQKEMEAQDETIHKADQLKAEKAQLEKDIQEGRIPSNEMSVGYLDYYEREIPKAEEASRRRRQQLEKEAQSQSGNILKGAESGTKTGIEAFAKELDRIGQGNLANQLRKIDPKTVEADEQKRKEVHEFGPTMDDFRRGQKEDFKRSTEFGPTMEDFRKGQKDRVNRYASALQEGFNGQALFGNGNQEWVAGQLRNQGMKAEDAKEIAADVMAKLQDAYDKKVNQEAGRLNTDKAGAQAKMRSDFVEKQREHQMGQVEANMGMAVAQRQLWADLYKAPERIAMTDVAKHVESGGAKDQLQVMREQLDVMKAIERATKVANNPPKLGR